MAQDHKTINPRCYMDFKQGNERIGRIIIELFADIVPRTVANFISLCKGDSSMTINNRKTRLYYKNSIIHRVIRGFMIQMGDFTKSDGTGGISMYGKHFDDENFKIKHNKYYLSMANAGPQTNGSQFFICTAECEHLNGKHVVFGRIINGTEVVDKLESVETNSSDKPLETIIISKCGQLVLMNKPKNTEHEQTAKDEEEEDDDDDSDEDIEEDEDSVESESEEEERKKRKKKPKKFNMNSVNFVDESGRTRKGRGKFKHDQYRNYERDRNRKNRGKSNEYYNYEDRYENRRLPKEIRIIDSKFLTIDNDTNAVLSMVSALGMNGTSHRNKSRSRSRSR